MTNKVISESPLFDPNFLKVGCPLIGILPMKCFLSPFLQKPGILEEFLTCLITVLSKVYNLPNHDFSLVYGFILECLKLLIVLLSSQMFNHNPKYQTKFSRLLNQLGFEINMRLIKSAAQNSNTKMANKVNFFSSFYWIELLDSFFVLLWIFS